MTRTVALLPCHTADSLQLYDSLWLQFLNSPLVIGILLLLLNFMHTSKYPGKNSFIEHLINQSVWHWQWILSLIWITHFPWIPIRIELNSGCCALRLLHYVKYDIRVWFDWRNLPKNAPFILSFYSSIDYEIRQEEMFPTDNGKHSLAHEETDQNSHTARGSWVGERQKGLKIAVLPGDAHLPPDIPHDTNRGDRRVEQG